MKLYSCNAIEDLINEYMSHDGIIENIDDGVLGYGTFVLSGDGLKYCVVTEVYLNEYSSGHNVRFYNELPKKWEQAIQDAYNNREE